MSPSSIKSHSSQRLKPKNHALPRAVFGACHLTSKKREELAAMSVVLDKTTFWSRLKSVYASWNQAGPYWGGEQVVDALQQIGQVFTEVETLTSQIAQGTIEQQQSTASINDNMSMVVELSRELNSGLSSVAELAEMQQNTAAGVDTTLNRICV